MEAIKEYIHQTIDKLDEANLGEIYLMIQKLSVETSEPKEQNLFSKLRRIQIEGPEDFAANCDAYVLGKKYA